MSLGHGGVTFQCFCLPKAIILNPVCILHTTSEVKDSFCYFLLAEMVSIKAEAQQCMLPFPNLFQEH